MDLLSQFKQFELNIDDFFDIKFEEEDDDDDDNNCIGGGAEGHVYLKLYKNQPVAVKVLSNYVNKGEVELSLLRREIGYLTRLKHPYISEFVGYLLMDNRNEVWLVSKYIEDGNLECIINKGILSPDDKKKKLRSELHKQ